ncbi:SRPBCC family protein [Brachybacterium saurashtrense]|uniref:SRPBCC family protein n=1 Tax=Brachybacterium saurashtrense TaxID=556288 RepID=A0A345YP44_9MICO|nr:SRPBCC family protein [Brachybacterium saurashtrense]AXK45696.1 SRPBCC family protein [Brachybacterium saurashtrense]RRR24714.1 SRPBCC family protein [Brachybacterium saurashtrense]
MEFTVSLPIPRPRRQVLELLSNPAHHAAWVRDLLAHELVSGTEGQVGAVSRVEMRSGKGTMEARETITRRDPERLEGIAEDVVVHYERELVAPGMWSAAREHLHDLGDGTTLWESENEYRFDARAMRLLAPLMRRAFRTQTLRHMEDFRAFAVHGTDVRGADARGADGAESG